MSFIRIFLSKDIYDPITSVLCNLYARKEFSASAIERIQQTDFYENEIMNEKGKNGPRTRLQIGTEWGAE